ncbi:MAG: L-aspartate oxidase [Hyphomonadaceae bacterium]
MATRLSLGSDVVLIVGAGLAGLFLAQKLRGRKVVVVSSAPLGKGAASAWAQGGLAAALAPEDSPALHAADTVAAGGGLVDPAVALLVAEAGPDRVRDLLALGVPFDQSPDGALRQSLEAAHSRPRVVRVSGDLAGKAIMDALITATQAADHIQVLEGLNARALLQDGEGRVRGVLARDAGGDVVLLEAGETVLASGGAGGLFRVTTNPPSSLADGMAMAARAGGAIADPEFVQFHPTAIDIGRDPAPLATEALRGEGARLVDVQGAPFMQAYDPRGELAPRDIVARAIHAQLAAGEGAFLDARDAVGADFPDHFPTVFAACMSAGIDPRVQAIPVAPAAHYHMGGIVTDLWAQTSLAHLSAVGECASTGEHGANRLASNSLLESVVFAARAAERLLGQTAAPATQGHAETPPELPAETRRELRVLMDAKLGVAREAAGLAEAQARIAEWTEEYGLCNETLAAALIAQAAAARRCSIGAHYRSDFPDTCAPPQRTFLTLAQLDLPARAKETA